MVSADRVRELLSYDPITGSFTWLVKRPHVEIGQIAGHMGIGGYWTLKIDGQIYKAHRIAWLFQTGTWPSSEIDHINGHRADNSWINLRLATHSQNQANGRMYRNNKCGFKGVSPTYTPPGRFRARIRKDGTERSLGVFLTAEEAHRAYVEAAKILHGDFWRAK